MQNNESMIARNPETTQMTNTSVAMVRLESWGRGRTGSDPCSKRDAFSMNDGNPERVTYFTGLILVLGLLKQRKM